jgi:hypothetical protein
MKLWDSVSIGKESLKFEKTGSVKRAMDLMDTIHGAFEIANNFEL